VIAIEVRGRAKRIAAATRARLLRRVGRAMRAAGLDDAELSLALSDDRELHALNLLYAGEDHPTDVLSFEQASVGERRVLGDVIISVEYAKRQAQQGLDAELFHLAVHGLVHLCGYDHRTKAQERVMFGYEDELRRSALSAGAVRPVNAPRKGAAAPAKASPARPRRRSSRGKADRPPPRAHRSRSRR
jgi:probable rRNA maturation factor